eukprot:scaffold825_cov249-Pinguiococcus_pyrenoidosus.AAC.18
MSGATCAESGSRVVQSNEPSVVHGEHPEKHDFRIPQTIGILNSQADDVQSRILVVFRLLHVEAVHHRTWRAIPGLDSDNTAGRRSRVQPPGPIGNERCQGQLHRNAPREGWRGTERELLHGAFENRSRTREGRLKGRGRAPQLRRMAGKGCHHVGDVGSYREENLLVRHIGLRSGGRPRNFIRIFDDQALAELYDTVFLYAQLRRGRHGQNERVCLWQHADPSFSCHAVSAGIVDATLHGEDAVVVLVSFAECHNRRMRALYQLVCRPRRTVLITEQSVWIGRGALARDIAGGLFPTDDATDA